MGSKIYDIGKSELQKIVDESNSYADVLKTLNMSAHGSNYKTLRKTIDELNIDLTKIRENRKMMHKKVLQDLGEKRMVPLEEIISGQYQKEYQGYRLRDRLIQSGLKEHKCECCENTKWLQEPIPLQVHHKDGNHLNNKLDNLQLLCPNCHSLTDTFAGKNIKPRQDKECDSTIRAAKVGWNEDKTRYYDGYGEYKVLCPVCRKNLMNKAAEKCRECYKKEKETPSIDKEQLYKDIAELNSYAQVAIKYQVSRKTIRHWHRYYADQDKQNGVITIISDKAPSREILKKRIREESFTAIGESYGVDDNAVRKWCLKYNLPFLKRQINKIQDIDWDEI